MKQSYRRFCISLLWALIHVAATAQGAERLAELVIEGERECSGHAASSERLRMKYTLTLPEVEGPVSGNGEWTNSDTINNWSGSGPSTIWGEVVNDDQLRITGAQFVFEGMKLGPNPPGATEDNDVVLSLEPENETTLHFENMVIGPGSSCSGFYTYKLELEREKQVWKISLLASRKQWSRDFFLTRDGLNYSGFDFVHGVTFNYQLSAVVSLEKRKKTWIYREGTINQASIDYEYHQDPVVNEVAGMRCKRCSQVRALVGQLISGWSDGSDIELYWPDIRPVLELELRYLLDCVPGPHQTTCERLKIDGGKYGNADTDTLQRAAGHVLSLAPGNKRFRTGDDSETYEYTIVHDYTLTRIK